jgi:hypothetical protein
LRLEEPAFRTSRASSVRLAPIITVFSYRELGVAPAG